MNRVNKKDRLICFRSNKNLHESLDRLARAEKRSLSSMIEVILADYLKKRKLFKYIKKEKRQYPRKPLFVPALINQQDNRQIGIGVVADISLSGIKILIPKDYKQKLMIDSQDSLFDVVFNIPNESMPIRLSCEAKRIVDNKDEMHVGAYITDANFKDYKALQTYLM